MTLQKKTENRIVQGLFALVILAFVGAERASVPLEAVQKSPASAPMAGPAAIQAASHVTAFR
jgi:hypothetical protein